MVYFTFTLFLQWKEAILTKSSLLCENYDKFGPGCKFLASNNEATLIYWPIKNTF